MKPLYLEAAGYPVAGIYHAAETTPSGVGVLLVPPFGWDDQGAYRPRMEWANVLAAAGHAALRIDLPGSGDSGGTPRDPELLAAWTAAITAGVDWLRAAHASRVAVAAMGLGGLITLNALAAGTRVDDLVLWGMPVKGRGFVRELKAFGRLEASQTGEDPSTAPEGEVRAGGHVLSPETAAAVSGLDATKLFPAGGAARALVMGRDGIGPEDALLEALGTAGVDVRTNRGQGWGGILSGPPSVAPQPLLETVNAWLAETAPGGDALAPPATPDTAEIGPAGQRVRETPVVYHHEGTQLYAVLTEPVDRPVGPGTIVLYNSGTIRHIGPNRMWTEGARRWAAAGIPVLRVDIEGIGDAEGDTMRYLVHVNNYHTQPLVDQARSALDLAVEHGLPDRFLLGGMCAGGYWAFHVAHQDPRAVGIMTLNQRVMLLDPDAEGHRELGRFLRSFTPQGFRYMLMGDRRWFRLKRLMKWLAMSPVRWVRSLGTPPAPVDPLSEILRTMHDRGQTLDLGFSAEEELHDALTTEPRLTEVDELGVQIYDLPFISHTLKPVDAQRAANKLFDDVVARTFTSEQP